MGRHGLASGLAALLLVAGAVSARQDQPGQTPPSKPPKKELPEGPLKTLIDAEHAVTWEEGDVTVTYLTGGVTIQRPDSRLHASQVMLWKKKDSKYPYDELYAEGNVTFVNGVQKLNSEGGVYFKVGDQKMNCERFFTSNLTQKSAVVDVRMKAYSKDLKTDFFAMAKRAQIDSRSGKMVADDVSLTSCEYGVPHYHLSLEHATLLGGGPSEPGPESRVHLSPFGDEWSADFDQLIPEFSGIPLFFLPGFSVGPWLVNFPLRSFTAGHTSLFGNFAHAELGSRIRFADEKGKMQQWGDLALNLDYRQIRGEAGGIDLKYKWDGYSGFLDTYYMYDKGRRSSTFEDQFPPLEDPNRGKAHYFHRQDLDEHWRFELEAYYLSDSSLLEEFFPKEFKEMKPPETAAYLRWRDGDMGGFLLGEVRINNWQDQNEYMPRLDFNVLSHPILGDFADNVYLTERVDMVNIRHKYANDFLPSVGTWRLDFVTEVASPLDFRYFQIFPFVQNRTTWYESDLQGLERLRDIWTAGGRVLTQIHGTNSDFRWERVGIRGLRHVIELEARYTSNFYDSLGPGQLYPFEPVDQLAAFEEVSFELRQRFLTKDAANRPFEFLSASVGIEYYPDSYRDTRGPNITNAVPPFDWIPLTANPANGTFARRNWSDLMYEVTLRPRDFFSISFAGEYNPGARSEDVREVGITLTPFEGFTATVSQELVKGVTNAFSLGMTWHLTPKWAVSVMGQVDTRAGTYLTQELVVSRDFHDFSLEAVLEKDFTRNDNRYFVAFVPKFLGKAGLNRSHMYRPSEIVGPPSD